jgi:hypothetical protein
MEMFHRSKAMYKQSPNILIGHETIMTFGKYRGLRVKEILLKDKQYMTWLLCNDVNHMYGDTLTKELFKPKKLVRKSKPVVKTMVPQISPGTSDVQD